MVGRCIAYWNSPFVGDMFLCFLVSLSISLFLCLIICFFWFFISLFQRLFLVPLKGGRWHIIPQLAVYTTYIPLIYCLLGGYMLPIPPFRGTRNNHWWFVFVCCLQTYFFYMCFNVSCFSTFFPGCALDVHERLELQWPSLEPFLETSERAPWAPWKGWIHMCQGRSTPIISIGDGKLNPIVGVYIPIIRIPIKRWHDHPQYSDFWPWHM